MRKLSVKILSLILALTSFVGCSEGSNDVSNIQVEPQPIIEVVEEANNEEITDSDEETDTDVEEVSEIEEETDTDGEEVADSDEETDTDGEEVVGIEEETDTDGEEVVEIEEETDTVEEEVAEIDEETDAVEEEVVEIDEETDTVVEEVVEIDEETDTVVVEVDETVVEVDEAPVEVAEVEVETTEVVVEAPAVETAPVVTTSNVTPTTVPDATLKAEIYNMLMAQANSPNQMTVYGTSVPTSSHMYRNMLTSTEQQLYDQLYDGFIKAQTSFTISTSLSSDTLFKIAEYIHYDHPELIWINLMYYSIKTSNGVVTVNASETYNGLQNSTSNYYSTMATILANAKNLPSDYDRIKYIQNYISYYTTFDVSYVNASDSQTAYSCLVGKRTVCAGYARAFQHCMQLLGIPTTTISGSTIYGSHLWNLLTLDGQNYIVDVNWDDWSTTPTQYNYSYFMITDAQLSASRGSHVRSSFSANIPYAYGTTNSYANKG